MGACSYKGDYKYYLNNASSHELKLVYFFGSISDTIIAKPGENNFIRYFQGDEGLEDKGDKFLSYHGFENMFFLPLNDSTFVLKDPKKRDSWDYTAESYGNSSKAGTNIYTITIQNEDIGM